MLTSLFIIFIIIYLSWFFFLTLARSRLVLSGQKKSEPIKVREGGGGCSCKNESVCPYGQFRSLDLHISVIKWSVSLLGLGVCVCDCSYAWKLWVHSCKLRGVLMYLRVCACKCVCVYACKCVVCKLSCYEKAKQMLCFKN